MNKNLKRTILIVAIIVSVAIVFVPIYFFVLADSGDDNKFSVTNTKIISMIDGTSSFDENDTDAGNDSSGSNKRVRTFDRINYTVAYTLTVKNNDTVSEDGRNLLVEVLIPTTYSASLDYNESSTTMDDRIDASNIVNIGGTDYYYGSFSVPTHLLGEQETFDFSLSNINSSDISNYNTIKPLVFIKESTDQDTPSIKDNTSRSDITCELENNDNDCNVTLTGKEEYFVNMYSGSKEGNTVSVGLMLGLRNQGSGKGIKGLIIPSSVNFTITNSDASLLSFDSDSEHPYKRYSAVGDVKITTNGVDELPEVNSGSGNGTISGSINNNVLTISLSDIKDYFVTSASNLVGEPYYFSTNYFTVTFANRAEGDYADRTINLTSSVNNNSNTASVLQLRDSYEYILGNYSSSIDVYESNLTTEDLAKLDYGKANINYGGNFTLKTEFTYNNRTDSLGRELTSLTNYVKIDNSIITLHNNPKNNKSYDFNAVETSSVPSIKIDSNDNNQKVYFGFGEWNSDYFELASNAPSGCPNSIDSLTKDNLMNLYGGPCIVEKNTLKWAYSPESKNDINGEPIASTKGPLIVKSTYIAYNDNSKIGLSSGGTLELYGYVNDYSNVPATASKIVTCATAYGKDNNDFRYLGDQYNDGEALLKSVHNFEKTAYSFDNKSLITLNNTLCNTQKCPVSGNTILASGIKVTKPTIKAYDVGDLNNPEDKFYTYPLAIKINGSAKKSTTDDNVRFDSAYIDIYLPAYMVLEENFGVENEKIPTAIDNTSLENIYMLFGKGTPASNVNYKVYHYTIASGVDGITEEEINNLNRGIINNFTTYYNIDFTSTPNGVNPEIFATIDFKATEYVHEDGGIRTVELNSITPNIERTEVLNNITLYNSSAVVTNGSSSPKNIEKNGSYTFNMISYNHSNGMAEDESGYNYPTADLYYVLPYNGDTDNGSKIGSTKYKVNFTSESINAIADRNDYKFYYATSGVPANIISDEIKTTSDPSAIWNLWTDPTSPVSNVIAIKVVKQSPFMVDTYFGSSTGLTVNVETVDSNDGNTFYNVFHLLATKPNNYVCETNEDDSCTEVMKTKANYVSSASLTSIYSREISGFVFEDSDYNGIYTSEESRLKDIPVSLYKIDTLPEGTIDPYNPTTFVNENDKLIGSTVTGENGNYYFGGLTSGYYYVSYTINDEKYVVTGIRKTDSSIPDSSANNSSGALLPDTNKAISELIELPANKTTKINDMNLGLNVKKEMAISLNKYITEVTVTKNGKVDTYDYSNKNLNQVTISVINPKDTKVRVKYSFVVENTKYYPGYIGMIVDSMPKDMTFNPDIEENKSWVMYDNFVYYNGLSGKLLLPNEKQYFSLVLDLDLKEAGTYRNVVSVRDLTLMGEDLPIYDFAGLNKSSIKNTEGGE